MQLYPASKHVAHKLKLKKGLRRFSRRLAGKRTGPCSAEHRLETTEANRGDLHYSNGGSAVGLSSCMHDQLSAARMSCNPRIHVGQHF